VGIDEMYCASPAPCRELASSCAPRAAIYSGPMASKTAFLDDLRQIPLFRGCTKKELMRLSRAGDEVDMKAGALLADQGQTGREAFIIMDGTVSVKRNGRKVATLGPGTIVGELSLLDHGPRTATVTCDTDAKVFVISQRHFLAMLDDVPTIGHKLMASLASRIRELDRQYYG
jgi:CRP/FNR family transcriptional regulator, cyclic AMP receptor protein